MSRITRIPLHQQQATAVGGIEILHLVLDEDQGYDYRLKEHRDEYYSLIIVLKGGGNLWCDMEPVPVYPRSVLLMKPYQVHGGDFSGKGGEFYFISIAPFLVPECCRDVFGNTPVFAQCQKPAPHEMQRILKTTELLLQVFNGAELYKTQVTGNLLQALLLQLGALFLASRQQHDPPKPRAFHTTQKFRELISKHSFLHMPSFYAQQLHITTAHLNDCVRSVTGLSVTKFLQQAMLLEAKRHLYYTNADVKKIAFDLGFEDHAYFSRLFKKLAGVSPRSFRNQFRA